jgi:diadenosine tetraphosphate (Ap4A) HIT family hydrolase
LLKHKKYWKTGKVERATRAQEEWDGFLKKEGYRLVLPSIPTETQKEAPDFIVLLDRAPKVLGHTLVICKYPYDDVCDATDKALAQIGKIVSTFSRRIKEVLKAEKVYVYSMCDHFEKWELKTPGTTEHLHFHLLPRYSGNQKGEALFTLFAKSSGVDWEAAPITLEDLAKRLKTKGMRSASHS